MKTSPEWGGHLTDEQFAELLAGESLHGRAEAHLAGCPHCRGEVEAVQGSLGAFNQLSSGWAEGEARRRIPVPSRWALRLGAHPAWRVGVMTAATAAAVAIGLQFPRHPAPSLSHAQVVVADPTRAELAVDNRLMTSIDAALRDGGEPTIPVAELRAAPAHAAAHLQGTVEN